MRRNALRKPSLSAAAGGALLAAILMSVLSADDAAARTITIAVVRDGQSPSGTIVDLVRAELQHMVGDQHTLVFAEDARYDAGWDPARVGPALTAAMKDTGVDLVLGVGQLVAQEAARPERTLPRPFVGATVLIRDLPAVAMGADGRLVKPNLSLIILPRRAEDEVAALKATFRVQQVQLAFGAVEYGALDGFTAAISALSGSVGLPMLPLPVAADWRAALASFDPAADLCYLLPTPQLAGAERGELIAGLAARGIPTVSGVGPDDLDLGAVATFRQDMDEQAARRAALNLHHLIRGGSTTELAVLMSSDLRLVIDGPAAAAVGLQPGFETLVLADIRQPEALDTGAQPIDLAGLIALADTGSVSLSISRQRTETSEQERKSALGPLLPQLGLSAQASYYDLPSVGTVLPEQLGRVGLGMSQMIYDDQAISGYRQTGRFRDASYAYARAERLDVFLEVEQGFFDLQNATIYRDIQLDNLRVTGGNLDLARTRAAVGQGGQDEVYRWEAELAKQRAAVLDAEATVEAYRISLNRILGVRQDTRWRPEPVDPAALRLQDLVAMADPDVTAPKAFERFEAASVAIAVTDAPELLAIDYAIEAQGIGVGVSKRTFFLPRVYADASLHNNFYQDPDSPDISGQGFEARIVASLPIFEGTRRVHELAREKSVLIELERERLLTRDFVEQRTRTALRRLRSAVPSVDFALAAAENSRLNFDVVRDKYANGIVGITDLLDAQNSRLRDDLGAVAARYTLLRDLAAYERALSFFAAAATAEEQEQLAARLRAEIERQE